MLVHTSQSIQKLSFAIGRISSFGQLGVQLFFVISAFTLSLSSDTRRNEKDKSKRFFIRRFFRIAPLYYFGITVYFLLNTLPETLRAGHLQILPDYSAINIIANITFIHGFYPPANNNVVPGGWSIGTEMAFYLCFPLLFFLYDKIYQKGSAFLLGIFTLVTTLYYLIEGTLLHWEMGNSSFIYFNLLNQLPVFALGILAYFLSKNQLPAKIPLMIKILFLLFFSWLTAYVWNLRSDYSYPFLFIPFIAGLTFFFLYTIFSTIDKLNFPILQRIGQLSYSMYIFHFIFALNVAGYLNQSLKKRFQPDVRLGIAYTIVILLTFLVATVSERLIEKPGINLGKMLINKMNG